MKRYPNLQNDSNKELKNALDFIVRERTHDIEDRNSFPNIFVGGRKVSKVPTSSSDVTGSAVGDMNVTTTYAYFCVNNSGTPEWVRVAVGTF